MMAYISRISQLRQAVREAEQLLKNKTHKEIIIIIERSIYTDKNVFAKMLYDDKKIEEINYKIYLKWFDEFINDIHIENFIYLRTIPEICLQRVKKRARGGETIPLEYLKRCSKYHDKWIGSITTHTPIILEGNSETTDYHYNMNLFTVSQQFLNI